MRAATSLILSALTTALLLTGCADPTTVEPTPGLEPELSSEPAAELAPEPVPTTAPPPPAVSDVGKAPASDAQQLAQWTLDPAVEPKVRYASLRRLEQLDDEALVPTALALIQDEDRFIRLNAAAVLARSDDPRAQRAIRALEPRYRRAAELLALREGGE